MGRNTALIIGGGPAGLTAAYELATKTDITPIVFEKSDLLGGIARTVNYKGNRIDIGGHRFFSKSDRVMQWWQKMLPMQAVDEDAPEITYQQSRRSVDADTEGPHPETCDRLMLVRERKSRIYFLRQLFDYPLKLNADTILKLGLWRVMRIGMSYVRASLRPIRPERNLEEFLINRFGRELYLTFFKSYTEKVWGVPCEQISAEWGAQRIKGLSIRKSIAHALRKMLPSRSNDVAQKEVETSLIERFLYPKFGPGQLWEEVARRVEQHGGTIRMRTNVRRLFVEGNRIVGVEVEDAQTGEVERIDGDHVFSTMPVSELVGALDAPVPANVREVAEALPYRDFLTVGLLVDRLLLTEKGAAPGSGIKDNWIYVQEPDVVVGRLQIFNNWSPYMVADPSKVWIGLEYFCYETDELWNQSDEQLVALAKEEMERIGIVRQDEVRDATVIRMPKTYPAYFGVYERFDEVRGFLDGFENLFLVGRNGMHKYNNQDHSMLTAMLAVENIQAGVTDKSNLWDVNTEQDYHEAKSEQDIAEQPATADCEPAGAGS